MTHMAAGDTSVGIMEKNASAHAIKVQNGADPENLPYSNCFARTCKHLVNEQCNLFTVTRPPTIITDGMCMGFET